MRRCLELAAKGLGHVAPNPMVGAVLVYEGRIVSEGYHERYGQAHAEVNALKDINDPAILQNSTLYVTLEPCSHHGKTPPCSDLIIAKGIPRVVVGSVDTNPLVGGKGIRKLEAAGIQVISGILDRENRTLNKRFFTFHEQHRPYVILKWAQTADGFISRDPLPASSADNWISGPESKALVHLWRSQEQAIMVGTNTALADNPQLTTRLVQGANPLRVVLDRQLKLPTSLQVFNEEADTLVFTEHPKASSGRTQYAGIDAAQPLIPQVLHQLYQRQVNSLLVEGGTRLLQGFIDSGLWDEARVFVNPDKHFDKGIQAPGLDFGHTTSVPSGNDHLFIVPNPVRSS